MNRFRLISSAALVALLALAVTACGGSSSTTTATQTVTETQAQTQQQTQQQQTQQNTDQQQNGSNGGTVYTEDNTTINVTTGDSFTIQLPVNPSTGYHWETSLPMGYVQVSDDILKPADQGNIVGQGTAEQWVFSADTAGTATIDFSLFAPGGTQPEKSVTFTVNAS